MSHGYITQSYIEEERERCATLAEMLAGEPDFLIFCIRAPAWPNEIADQRKRFDEQPDPIAELL